MRIEKVEYCSGYGILSDQDIIDAVDKTGMISPFRNTIQQTDDDGQGILSYGLSCGGYDVRAAPTFKVMKQDNILHPGDEIIDVKKPGIESHFQDVSCDVLDLRPYGFALTHTIETFRIPEDVMVTCYTKSTYARCGLSVFTTIIEPGQTGHIVLEIFNHTDRRIRFYANEGCAQFVFSFTASKPKVPYNKRNSVGGKYMNQQGIVMPRVK